MPAKTFGIAEHIGSLEDGKLADIVIWRPAFFGIKPELVIKGGFIAWGAMGDSAASLMTCEPILLRPQWGAFGRAAPALSACFVHPLALDAARRDARAYEVAVAGARARAAFASPTCCETTLARISASILRPSRFSSTARWRPASPRRALPLAQRYMLR